MQLAKLKRILPWFLIVIIAFSIIAGAVALAMNGIMLNYSKEMASAKADALVYNLDGRLHTWQNTIDLLAANSVLQTRSRSEALDYLNAHKDLLADFDFLFIGSPDGSYTTTMGQSGNVSDREYFPQVMAGKTIISSPVVSKTTGKPIIVIAAPIRNDQGQIVAILAGTVTLQQLSDSVNDTRLGQTGYAFMLDQAGTVIAHPDPALLLQSNMKDSPDNAMKRLAENMTSQDRGLADFDLQGTHTISAYTQLKSVPWSVAVVAPANELYLGINILWALLAGIALIGFGFLLVMMMRAFRKHEQDFQELLNSINAGVAVYSPDMELLYVNPPVFELISEKYGDGLELHPELIEWFDADGNELPPEFFPARQALETGEAINGDIIGMKNPLGKGMLWFLVDCFPLPNPDGSLRQLVMTLVNVTERKKLEEELHYYSTTDTLTGAHNRRSGLSILHKMLEMCKRQGFNLVVCYIDLDDLKKVNDTCGHSTGDEYIRLVADVLQDSIRASDTLVRLGGDEFLIVLPKCVTTDAMVIMSRVSERLNEINLKKTHPFKAHISFGFGEYVAGLSFKIEALIAKADEEMYRNKQEYKMIQGQKAE